MNSKAVLLVLISVLVVGCKESDLSAFIAPAPSGQSSAESRQTSIQQSSTTPSVSPSTEFSESVIATSPENAENLCRERSTRGSLTVTQVQTPLQVQRGQNQQYECWLVENYAPF